MSNELKVTGGEWRAERVGDDWLILNDSNECVETVYTGEANAHLLAASKKLYEALDAMRSMWATVCDAQGWERDHLAEYSNAIAALAAARGEDR